MWHHNVDLLAYHDLDGRSGFKLALQEVGGRFFLYVAGFWHSGWSILEVTDPEHPELLRFLEGPPNTMTIQVQVADGTMITALEHPPPGLTIGDPAAPQDGFLIWDVREPDRPQLLGQWVSGAAGTHRNFYNGGPWVYATSSLPGFEGQVLAIVDIADPANPKTAGTWWHPGQHKAAGETYTPEDQRRLTAGRPYPQHGLSLHGGAYALGDRAYCPWMRGGMVILDIADKHHPKHVSTLPVYPPLGSTIAVHSAVPLPGRDVVVINDEALRENCDEPASYVATVDISDESDPIMMAGRARHARQRRHAECLVLVGEQLGPGSQVGEELVEQRVEGVRLGDPPVSLPDVQDRVNDIAEYLVEGSGRIVALGRAHAGTDAGRRHWRVQGRATGLRHPTPGDLLISARALSPASSDEIRLGSGRSSRGQSAPRLALCPRRRLRWPS
jgi:hypothetical protein